MGSRPDARGEIQICAARRGRKGACETAGTGLRCCKTVARAMRMPQGGGGGGGRHEVQRPFLDCFITIASDFRAELETLGVSEASKYLIKAVKSLHACGGGRAAAPARLHEAQRPLLVEVVLAVRHAPPRRLPPRPAPASQTASALRRRIHRY